jgi:hypothetical protein
MSTFNKVRVLSIKSKIKQLMHGAPNAMNVNDEVMEGRL